MDITIGNKEQLKLSLTNKLTGAAITDLASTTEIKFQIQDAEGTALLTKLKTTSGIVVNSPATGDITVTILNTDWTLLTEAGDYYIAVQIEYSATDKREILITENGKEINTINVKQERIT
jgi:hypothetical protein